jgi:hypothetical protein
MSSGTADTDSKLSFVWFLLHGACYINGGLTFLIGSVLYYPQFNPPLSHEDGDFEGSLLFTFGSLTFLIADIQEWLLYAPPCLKRHRLLDDGSPERAPLMHARGQEPDDLAYELGLNFFLSAIGSLLYLLGSIFIIPSLNTPNLGAWGFIIGSVFVWLAQLWKVHRMQPLQRQHWTQDEWSAFQVDFMASTGGFWFLVGTAASLSPRVSITAVVNMWVVGSVAFTWSGCALLYRHFVLHK